MNAGGRECNVQNHELSQYRHVVVVRTSLSGFGVTIHKSQVLSYWVLILVNNQTTLPRAYPMVTISLCRYYMSYDMYKY